MSGDYEGREAIFGFFGELGQRSESTFAIEIHDILANDEHTVVLTSLIAGGSHGKTLSTHTSDVSHIRNGQIVEFWSFTQDPYAWDDYLSD